MSDPGLGNSSRLAAQKYTKAPAAAQDAARPKPPVQRSELRLGTAAFESSILLLRYLERTTGWVALVQ